MQYFVLRHLFTVNFFKLVIIVLLKIYATGKIFGNICRKAIKDTFFSNIWLAIKVWTEGTQLFGGVDIQQKEKVKIFGLQGESLQFLL